jgi:hypothetical protein
VAGRQRPYFHIQFRMVDMSNLERSITMARCLQLKIPENGLICVRGAAAFSL